MEYVVLRRRTGVLSSLENVAMGSSANVEVLSHDVTPADVRDLKRDPQIDAFAPAIPLKLIKPTVNSHEESVAWGIEAVGASNSPFHGTGVTVAVLDTGIDKTHTAFAGMEIIGRNFTNGPPDDVTDLNSHGTHCAGTIFGRDVAGKRIGVARGVSRAVIGKVLGSAGGSTSTLASAIQWAVDQGAHIISMSLGMDLVGFREEVINLGRHPLEATSLVMSALIDNVRFFDKLGGFLKSGAAFNRNALVVAASGNESGRDKAEPFVLGTAFPAATEDFVSVGAVRKTENVAFPFQIADFSNAGAKVAGPGVGILSAIPGGGLGTMSGTSMATPHIAGIAALWAQKLMLSGRAVPNNIITRLLSSCKLTPGLDTSDVGEGIPQAPMN